MLSSDPNRLKRPSTGSQILYDEPPLKYSALPPTILFTPASIAQIPLTRISQGTSLPVTPSTLPSSFNLQDVYFQQLIQKSHIESFLHLQKNQEEAILHPQNLRRRQTMSMASRPQPFGATLLPPTTLAHPPTHSSPSPITETANSNATNVPVTTTYIAPCFQKATDEIYMTFINSVKATFLDLQLRKLNMDITKI